MKYSTSDLHVVYSHSEHGGVSLTTEEVFTEKSEADSMCENLNREAKRIMPHTTVRYDVTTLYAFMSRARDDALDEGRFQERQTQY